MRVILHLRVERGRGMWLAYASFSRCRLPPPGAEPGPPTDIPFIRPPLTSPSSRPSWYVAGRPSTQGRQSSALQRRHSGRPPVWGTRTSWRHLPLKQISYYYIGIRDFAIQTGDMSMWEQRLNLRKRKCRKFWWQSYGHRNYCKHLEFYLQRSIHYYH